MEEAAASPRCNATARATDRTSFLWTNCGPTEAGLWGDGACKCDTRKALDFLTSRFGTRRSMVQIHSPRPFETLSPNHLRICSSASRSAKLVAHRPHPDWPANLSRFTGALRVTAWGETKGLRPTKVSGEPANPGSEATPEPSWFRLFFLPLSPWLQTDS